MLTKKEKTDTDGLYPEYYNLLLIREKEKKVNIT
jgi:hypothetical protein